MDKLIAGLREQRFLVGVVGAFIVGLFLGLVVLGWNVWPVVYYDTDPSDLKLTHKKTYIALVADSYALNQDAAMARARLDLLEDPEIGQTIGEVALGLRSAGKSEEAARASQLAEAVTGGESLTPQPTTTSPTPAESEAPSFWGRLSSVCGILVFLLLLGAGGYLAFLFFTRSDGGRRRLRRARRERNLAEEEGESSYPLGEDEADEVEFLTSHDTTPEVSAEAEEGELQPLGRFSTTYNLGDDDFDSSFDVETRVGEFLGQCGIGVSEVLGDDEPQKVTAFEVWLFDKSDVRTVSTMLVSQYASQDSALQEKLSARGEIVTADKGKELVLETAKLRVDMQAINFSYAAGTPPMSHFNSLTVEFTVSGK